MAAATLKKISEITGLSIRSVSRALRGAPGLSEEKRLKALETAEKLGYTPNIAARNLRLRENHVVGMIIPGIHSKSGNYIISHKIFELELHLEREGYFPLIGMDTGRGEDMLSLLRQWAGMVKSVIILSWQIKERPGELLGKLPMQFIFVDIKSDLGHTLSIDRTTGVKEGLAALMKRPCRKLARCGNVGTRKPGFDAAMPELKKHRITLTYFPRNSEFEDGFSLGEELIKGKFDSVFFDTDRMAFGFFKYCYLHHIRIPEDIAVIGFDDEPWDRSSCPSLSTVAHPIEEVNSAIAALIKEPAAEPIHLKFDTRFIRRESV